VGTVVSSTNAVTPGIPSGDADGDLLVMACETADTANTTAAGWLDVPGSPVSNSATTRLTLLYKISTTGVDESVTNDAGNHQICRIIGITVGTFCSEPFGQYNENTQTTTTSVSISGVTTTINNALVLSFSSGELPDADSTTEFSSPANTDLGSVTERMDNCTSAGTGGTGGGCLVLISGTKASFGTVGDTTTTAANTATRANAMVVINGP